MENKLRLMDVWPLVPDNHNIVLRVKAPDRREYYTDRFIDTPQTRGCPYDRQFAFVLSVYAVTTETIEITVKENRNAKSLD